MPITISTGIAYSNTGCRRTPPASTGTVCHSLLTAKIAEAWWRAWWLAKLRRPVAVHGQRSWRLWRAEGGDGIKVEPSKRTSRDPAQAYTFATTGTNAIGPSKDPIDFFSPVKCHTKLIRLGLCVVIYYLGVVNLPISCVVAWLHGPNMASPLLLQILSYLGVVELTTQLLILENILWLPLSNQ